MASFLNANFDSEDEEDDDYNPSAADTRQVEKEEGTLPQGPSKAKRPSKRGRVPAPEPDVSAVDDAQGDAAEEQEQDDDDDEQEEPQPNRLILPKPGNAAAKRAKIEAVWQALNSRDSGGSNACGAPSSSTNLAALCRRSQVKSGPTPELTWQRQLGLVSPKLQVGIVVKSSKASDHGHADGGSEEVKDRAEAAPQHAAAEAEAAASAAEDAAEPAASSRRQQVSQDAKAAAAAALTAAKEAASLGVSRSYNKVSVTETRRFAGQDIQVTVQVDKDSKEAAKKESQKAAPSGLDRFLAELEKKKKVNILDKSKMDWNQLKSSDNQMEFELESHKRSNNKYLDKVDFLKKAELREYELERDKRLAGDIRLRNRL